MNGRPRVDPLRLRAIPMLAAALAFAAGILCGWHWHPTLTLTLSVPLLFALSCLGLRFAPRTGWLCVLGLWMTVGCWCAQVQPPAHRPTALHPYADGLSRTVRGRVVAVRPVQNSKAIQGSPASPTEPWLVEPGGWEGDRESPVQTLDLALSAVEEVTPDVSTMQPVTGGLRVTLNGGSVPLRCGEVVEIPVRLREPEVYRDLGAFSYADWLVRQGVSALATADVRKLRQVEAGSAGLQCRWGQMQHWAADRLERLPAAAPLRSLPALIHLSPDDTAMLAAMLFGDRTQLSEAQRAGFERTGTFHLFVVSGLHVALVTGALFWLLRRLRLPELPAVFVTIVLASGYALLTGFGVPVQRALAMSSLFLIARSLDRQRSGLNALGLAALLILVADPRALYEASFQMTALVIVAVAGVGVPVTERLLGDWRLVSRQIEVVELDAFLSPQVAQRRVVMRMLNALCRDLLGSWARRLSVHLLRVVLVASEAVLFSVAIELCMALPMAVYFHRMVPLALPANLLVSPLAALLTGCASATFVLGLLSPWLAAVPAATTAALLHLVQTLVNTLGHARFGDVRMPAPPAVAVVGCCFLLAMTLWALRSPRRVLLWSGVGALIALPLLVLWPTRPQVRPNALEVTAIDVGQGDALLVVSPQGRTMLVDAGGPVGRLTTKWDVGEQVVAPYLWSRQLRRLDVVVVTHGHSDHIGGMPAVLRDMRPRELWLSLEPGQSPAMRALLAQAAQLGIQIRWLAAGDALEWGGLHTTVLAPERTYANYGEARNDDSLVLRLDWERASVLLEGDAEAPSEAAMVAHDRVAPVSLLKVGHHGSRTSTSPDFLAAAAPRAAVISVGQHNTFGHPRWEVLDRLEASHVKTYRTDRQGAETFLLSADGGVSAVGAYP